MRDLRNQSDRADGEIDPEAFDDPRQLMWERLVGEYGQETIADLVRANLSQDLTAAGMQ